MAINEDNVDVVQEKNAGKNFVDREVQRQAFEINLKHIDRTGISSNGSVWIYSGVGGIGKTLLLDELKKLTEEHGKKFVRYDFKDGNNMVSTLKALCKNLSTDYQMEFPLFDKACIYLAHKSGEFVSAEQRKAVLESSSMFRSVKKNVSKAFTLQDKSSTAIKAGKSVVDENILVEGLQTLGEGVQTVAEGITEVTPIFKLGKNILNFFDKKIREHEEKQRKKGNTAYGKIAEEFKKLNAEGDPTRIREFLPTLFAQDLSFWLEENKTELIVFFDTYELLTGEERGAQKTVRLSSGDEPVDWWVGKLLAATRVMWVIAGRYEPKNIGKVSLVGEDGVRKNFVKSYPVDAFNEDWSNKYLQLLNVTEENLRGEIFKLTGGHPFYLHQCSITYKNVRAKGKLPSIKDFGKDCKKIIHRAIGTLDENGQYLTQCLCILNRWTDEVAGAVINDLKLNNITYERVKKLFARADSFDFDDDETVYTFDRTIDELLFEGLKANVTCRSLFANIRDAANKFFKKFFDENNRHWYAGDSKPEFYFGMWSEIILRTTDKPAELMTIYRENFAPIENRFDNTTRATIVKKFFYTVVNTKTLSSAYFQSRLGSVKFLQGETKEALELAEPAYNKVEKISLRDDERPIKILVMITLADVFHKLERYTDEIPLREKIVAEYKLCSLDKRDEQIIAAKNSLANALEKGDRQDEAFAIRQQIFELFDERDGEKFINAAKSFLTVLKRLNKFKEALPLLKKIVTFYETANDDQKLISALLELIGTLSDKEHPEEKVTCYRQYFALCQKTERNIPSGQLKDFEKILNKLGRGKEVTDFYKNLIDDLKRRIEVDVPSDKKTLELIKTLVEYLKSARQLTDARRWENKIKTTANAIIEQTFREPVENYDAAIATLNEMRKFMSNDEEKNELDRKILLLIEQNPDVDEAKIIKAKSKWLTRIHQKRLSDVDKRAECNRRFDELEDYYKQKLPASRADFSRTLSEHAEFLRRNGDSSAAVEKHKERLAFLEKDSATAGKVILDPMKKIAGIFQDVRNYSDELIWREKILAFCREHFAESSQEILDALYNLILVCKELKIYDKAEEYCRESVAVLEKSRGVLHDKTITENKNLVDILHEAGKFVDELNLRAKIVDLRRENFRMNPANRNELYRCSNEFINASDFNAADELDKVGRHDEATAGRIKLLEAFNAFLKDFSENYRTSELIADIRKKISGDAQALEKFDELFGTSATQDNTDEEFFTTQDDTDEEFFDTDDDADEEFSAIQDDADEETFTTEDNSPEENSALNKLTVDFRWNSDAALEINASAFLPCGDGRATMQVELEKKSDAVAKVSFTLTVDNAAK